MFGKVTLVSCSSKSNIRWESSDYCILRCFDGIRIKTVLQCISTFGCKGKVLIRSHSVPKKEKTNTKNKLSFPDQSCNHAWLTIYVKTTQRKQAALPLDKMILEIILGHSSDQSSWLCGQHRLHNGNFTTATAASTVYASIAAFCKQWKYKSAQICMYLTFCDNSELWILSNKKKHEEGLLYPQSIQPTPAHGLQQKQMTFWGIWETWHAHKAR